MRRTNIILATTLVSALLLPVASVSAAPGPQAAGHAKHVDRPLRELAAKHPGTRLPVLVQTKQNKGRAPVQAHGGNIKRELRTANLVAAEIPASRLDELANDADVVRVAYDAPLQSQTKNGGASGQGAPLTDMSLLSAYPSVVGAPAVWGYNLRGTGIGVAVLDSGIKDDRADFLGTLFGKNNGETMSTTGRVVKKVAISRRTRARRLTTTATARGWLASWPVAVGVTPPARLTTTSTWA